MTTDNKNIRELFNIYDKDKDGYISKAELIEIFQELRMPLKANEIGDLFIGADTTGDGKIDYFQLVKLFSDDS